MISFSEAEPRRAKNILGEELGLCCSAPRTGFFRDGFCHTNLEDQGAHVVCAVMTAEFLAFSRGMGNDLSTPRPEYDFPGLQEGDRWCLCALRWLEAYEGGCPPLLNPHATHERALEYIPLEVMQPFFESES